MSSPDSTGLKPGAKTMQFGELGLLVLSFLSAIGAVFIASKAWTPEYAFHAWLFAAASLASGVTIWTRYSGRPAAAPA